MPSRERAQTRWGQPSWLAAPAFRDNSKPATPPSPAVGYALIAGSLLFFLVGSYAFLFSAFLGPSGVWLLDVLARDTHYKYLAINLIISFTGFIIANWVGWQYYRNS